MEEIKNKAKEGGGPQTRQVAKNLIENKLFAAEQNREKELQKRLEHLRKRVGVFVVDGHFNFLFEYILSILSLRFVMQIVSFLVLFQSSNYFVSLWFDSL